VIDVIIPVYDGVEETRRCLESVRRTVHPADAEVVVVDDATPREEIARSLDELVTRDQITLIRHAQNQGFVRSVNDGMGLHPERDVVLLNSDTEVANDWLARLSAAAYSAGNIATVTPFSNNATICSYPFSGWTGGLPGTLGLERLDQLVASTNRGERCDLPTAVGFCMFIRRDCLRRIGTFDAERFGRGYGEENDFCLRAAKAGWRNLLAADVFVFHEGAVSFSGERETLMDASAAALLEAHPEYGRLVQEFIARDPLADLRASIDAERAASGGDEARAVVRERYAERGDLLARLSRIEALAAEREALIGRLDVGLAQATAIVEERTAQLANKGSALAERDAEIARLHQGLDRAEALALERAAELERIRRFWLWRFYWRAMRLGADAPGKDA
jgi:O-antigen biosynthesis protein